MSNELPDFDLKIRPGACIVLNGIGRMYVIESYQEAYERYLIAEPDAMVEFKTFATFGHTQEQVPYRSRVPRSLILAIDEFSDEMADAAEQDRQKHKETCDADPGPKRTETDSGLTVVELPEGEQ